MHPLHINLPKEIQERCVSENRYTGQSTRMALAYISYAMRFPRRSIKVVDHHNSTVTNRELLYKIRGMIEKLGLKHFVFNMSNNTIRFGEYDV